MQHGVRFDAYGEDDANPAYGLDWTRAQAPLWTRCADGLLGVRDLGGRTGGVGRSTASHYRAPAVRPAPG
jgi:hypothetical protein